MFLILNEYYLDCKKTQLIIYRLITPIEQSGVFDMNKRKVVELMYLLSTRCFCNLSFLREDIKEVKSYQIVKLQ